jgi:NADH:ubiquinone oxidoreductase subunit 5 (subunit L)/multisubunit Na+/H+ antiporter MnhA subunit
MSDAALTTPLALIAAATIVAALCGYPVLNRRLSITRMAWLLALLPLAAFVFFLSQLPAIANGTALTFSVAWMPSLGMTANLYFDNFSALFLLLVTGIGTLVIVYAGYYFKGDDSAWRFLAYLFLFMTAMVGVLLAGDVITLFVFWELTSVSSFLLIAYKTKDEAARRGAFKSLFITGGGGVALLAGVLFVSSVAGGTDYTTILNSGDVLRASPLYGVMLGLIAFGAFTKSAQVPAHIWLPDAMTAPTPASAYLHSATMVTAGVYLLARLNPALGATDAWFWLLTVFGLITMLTGAYLGLKQYDLKGLLAYSTVSQLGVMVMLIGDDTAAAFKALVISVAAHALYKSALFLIVGIVDHEAGTRDLRRLGGLRRTMPLTFGVALVAGLSMAGLPPMFGFLAKETLLASVTHPSISPAGVILLSIATVVAGALILAQAGTLVWDPFLGRQRDPNVRAHEAPRWMIAMPAIPALLSLAVGLLSEPERLAAFLARAASAAYGGTVKVSLALWGGITPPLILSVVAVSLGMVIWAFRSQVRAWQNRVSEQISFNLLYTGTLRLLDRAGSVAIRTQSGQLRRYLAVMLISLSALMLLFGRMPLPTEVPQFTPDEFGILRVFTLALATAAAGLSIFLRRDFNAILALGASGLSVAVIMVLEPAPDVALVQVVVDILSVVILVLALSGLPREQRRRSWELTFKQSRRGLVRDGLIAAAAGFAVMILTLTSLTSRPRASVVTPFYEANAKPLTGAADIVGAVVIDFRGFDTLLEIAVFGMAGLGVYTLLRYAARTSQTTGSRSPSANHALPAGNHETLTPSLVPQRHVGATGAAYHAARGAQHEYDLGDESHDRTIMGIGGTRPSPFVRILAHILLPIVLVLGAVQMMYGHDQAGDGFTAGVIISLAIAFWYIVFGYQETRRRLPWLKPFGLIGAGLLLVILDAAVAAVLTGNFFANLDYGKILGVPLPKGFALSTAFIFEVAICMTVLGGASMILAALGHPKDAPVEQ